MGGFPPGWIVHGKVASVVSRFPAASVARTRKVCAPIERLEYVIGETQVVKEGALSSLQANVVPVSGDMNPNVAFVLVVVADGFWVMIVSGAVWSIVQEKKDGLGSGRPAASFARTRKMCEPAARPVYCLGLVHAVHGAVSGTSSWHSKTRLPLGVTLSLPVNWKLADVAVVAADGCCVMFVSGGVVSEPPGGGGGGGGGVPGASRRTSCGVSVPFSRAWNCCSASCVSFASRMRKPLFPVEYIAWTSRRRSTRASRCPRSS